MNKAIISTTLSLMLFGCGQEYQSYKFSAERFTPEMGVAIIDMKRYAATINLIKFANADGSLYPILDDNGYYNHAYQLDPSVLDLLFSLGGSTPYVLLMEPGYYAFNDISYTVDHGLYYSNYSSIEGPALLEKNESYFIPVFGAFYVPPGEVVYIGDIFISYRSGNFSLKHTYYDEMISSFLKKQYPPLAEQVKRGKYYPGGMQHYFPTNQ